MSDTLETVRARIAADIALLMDKSGAQFVSMEIPGRPGMVFLCGLYPRELVDSVYAILAETFPQDHGRPN